MMKSWAEKNAGLAVIALVLTLLMPGAKALAHGGEDHGEKKARLRVRAKKVSVELQKQIVRPH